MNVERLAKRAHRRVVIWRIVGDLWSIIPGVLQLVGAIFSTVAAKLVEVEKAIWLVEIRAATEYRNLTGIDLGLAVAQPERYVRVFQASEVPPIVFDRSSESDD